MRHFKSVQFPTSGSHAQSSFVLNLFPIDVVLAILEHCSPFDLVELRRTSRLFRAIIASHQQLWVSSQRNLAIGTSLKVPSLPAIEASGNFSQWAYASWLFGGGPCTSCSKWTDRLPCNFVLRFRACSPSCQSILMFEPVLYVDRTRKHDNFSWGNWLPRIGRELSNGDTIHIYSSRAIKTAELERQQAIRIDRGTPPDDSMPFPCRTGVQLDEEYNRRARSRPELIKNAEALKDWQKLYMQQHDLVSQSNSEFLKLRSVEENRKFQGVMRCPTVSRLFFAFNRDLVTITHTIWGQNRTLVLAELKFLQHGVFPAGMTPRRNDKVRCPTCSRLVRVEGLAEHNLARHNVRATDTVLKPDSGAREQTCPECPRSIRLFNARGLKDHLKTKHSIS